MRRELNFLSLSLSFLLSFCSENKKPPHSSVGVPLRHFLYYQVYREVGVESLLLEIRRLDVAILVINKEELTATITRNIS